MTRIFLSPPWISTVEERLVAEAFAGGYVAPCGPMVDRFEDALAKLTGLADVCALSSGTAALDLVFRELGVGAGDRVVCSDLTFISSVGPAVLHGAEPVFVDCDEKSWTVDPVLLDEALAWSERTGRKAKAVVAVDLYGQCCDYDTLEEVCRAHGAALVIDAAEALGASYKGRPAGQAGFASVYSFNGNKIITTSGGGALGSMNAGLVSRARKRSQQSREPVAWYEHREVGSNYRLSNISAAIGVGQLLRFEEILAKKKLIGEWYRELLPGWTFMPKAPWGEPNNWLTVALPPKGGFAEITRLLGKLSAEGIEARPVWKPMHMQPVFAQKRVFGGKVSERLFDSGICLPSGCSLRLEDAEKITGLLLR